MRFFSYLFYPRGLKPYTTFHYRATSSQPLLIYFNIDQRVQAVHCVLITMKVHRPKEPSSRPAWNLRKVLTYLDNLDTSSVIHALRQISESLTSHVLCNKTCWWEIQWRTSTGVPRLYFLSFILCRPSTQGCFPGTT